jgi:hypothetical protein
MSCSSNARGPKGSADAWRSWRSTRRRLSARSSGARITTRRVPGWAFPPTAPTTLPHGEAATQRVPGAYAGMKLVALDLPDDPTELPGWLERQLVGLDLAELEAVHGTGVHVKSPHSLDELLGDRRDAVMARGLAALPREAIRRILLHPRLLLDLQERALVSGRDHWRRLVEASNDLDAVVDKGRRPLAGITRASKPEAKGGPAVVPLSRHVAWYRRPWVVSLATAASVLAAALIADFHGRENNQAFWGRMPRLFGDIAISVPGSLIIYLARNDSPGIKSTLAVLCMIRYIPGVPPGFQGPTRGEGGFAPVSTPILAVLSALVPGRIIINIREPASWTGSTPAGSFSSPNRPSNVNTRPSVRSSSKAIRSTKSPCGSATDPRP